MNDPVATLAKQLEHRFTARAARGVDAVVKLDLGVEDPPLYVTIRDDVMEVRGAPGRDEDVTFLFASAADAQAILTGQRHPIEAFMAGDLKADGHLVLTFRLLQMFRSMEVPGNVTD